MRESKTVQGMLNQDDFRKELDDFLEAFGPSLPDVKKAHDHIPGLRELRAASKNLGEWNIGTSAENLRVARDIVLCIGNMLGDENTHRSINSIEVACIAPVNEAQSA